MSADARVCTVTHIGGDLGNALFQGTAPALVRAGVRREGVTEAAGKLLQAGLIHYSRGRITVVDRPGLEALVCECYAVVKREFERLLPDPQAI